jgi:hypothetical protein
LAVKILLLILKVDLALMTILTNLVMTQKLKSLV